MGEMKRKMQQELEKDGPATMTGDGLYTLVEETTNPTKQSTIPRGRQVQFVFSMQGMGIFCNSLTMTVLLILTGQTNPDHYRDRTLINIWRFIYGLGAAVLIYVAFSRVQYLKESTVWQDDKFRREQLAAAARTAPPPTTVAPSTTPLSPTISLVSSVSSLSAASARVPGADDPESLHHLHSMEDYHGTSAVTPHPTDSSWTLLWKTFGVRLIGSSLSWLLWDIAFYGNKLFQSTFILTLTGDNTTLVQFSMAATLNAAVALCGYYGAAFLLDCPWIGRLRLQMWGFLLTGSLFVACGFLYNRLSSTALVAMYLTSSFVGQLGPNATTFLIPTEIFPTEMRTFCHGISAASGKLGALLAAVLFNYLSQLDMFMLSGYASFAACAITLWALPDTTGLDLYETDRKWRMTLAGRQAEYQGDASNPKYLSYFERSQLVY
jgi:hypothetical protein